MLYGDTLEESIGSEALAPELHNVLHLKPTILLIDKAGQPLFGRFILEYPPCALLETLRDPDLAMANYIHREGNLLGSTSFELKGDSQARVYAYIEDNSRFEGETALGKAASQMNLVTPFDRVRNVLAEIYEVDSRRQRR